MDQETEESSTPDQQQRGLKRQRGGAKAAVTRLMTQITTAMNCNQPKEVEMKLAALDEAVRRFHEIHDMYHKTLEDDDDFDASKGYLTSVLRDVQDLQHTVLSWLEDFKPSMESSDASNFQEEQQMLDEAGKPQMSPVDQLATQFQELHNLRQKENKEFSVLLAQQEERLRAEFKLQLQQAEFEMDGLKGLLKLKDAEMEENRRKAELTTINKAFSTPVSGETFIQTSSNKSRKNHKSPEMNMKVFYRSMLFLLGFFSVQTKAEVNIAAWGAADQSTTYEDRSAQKALDGLSSTNSRTNEQSDPWWKLDLMKTYRVNRVTITNRLQDCCDKWINGAMIRIGNHSSDIFSNPVCAVVSSIPVGATYSYSCRGMEGRYVSVNILGTSKILSFCEVGVYVIFPGNLATGRITTQSSTYDNWFAQQAIDFNPGFIEPSSSCSSTDIQSNPWWRVDLSSVYRVNRVVITNRQDCCPERINGAELRIGNSLENNGNNNPTCAVISSIPAGVSSTYTCNDMEGQYVNLFIPGDSKYLTLCEVEVYGEEDSCEDEPEV